MKMKIAILTFVACTLLREVMGGSEGFYNIAHMCNNVETIHWAVREGANALEMDLKFDMEGNPVKFSHGFPCDCTCKCSFCGNNVCSQLRKTSWLVPCNAGALPNILLNVIAKKYVAMVMIDSKIGKLTKGAQENAAKKMIQLLENELFGKGYVGQVIIGAGKFSSLPYIAKISETTSIYKDKIHFTIDEEDMLLTKKTLDRLSNKNVVYNFGVTHCSPKKAASTKFSKLAAINKVKGVWGMTYVWTIDWPSSLANYINYFNGIITNHPGRLAKVVREKNIRLATPNDVIPPATSKVAVTSTEGYELCDCDYTSGGCKITKPAPKGLACQCAKRFWWSCKGYVVLCSDNNSYYCSKSQTRKHACQLGRGNCNGY